MNELWSHSIQDFLGLWSPRAHSFHFILTIVRQVDQNNRKSILAEINPSSVCEPCGMKNIKLERGYSPLIPGWTKCKMWRTPNWTSVEKKTVSCSVFGIEVNFETRNNNKRTRLLFPFFFISEWWFPQERHTFPIVSIQWNGWEISRQTIQSPFSILWSFFILSPPLDSRAWLLSMSLPISLPFALSSTLVINSLSTLIDLKRFKVFVNKRQSHVCCLPCSLSSC